MKSHEAAVIFLVCLVFSGIILSEYVSLVKPKVYACSEVTKADPEDVQKICNKAWRRYEHNSKDN